MRRLSAMGTRRTLLSVFLTALVLNTLGALAFSQHPSLHWDASHYAILAGNLAEGHGLANEPGHPTAYRAPLYPVIVSLIFRTVGERYRAVFLFQALLASLTVMMAAWFTLLVSGRRAMLIAGILLALNPDSIQMTGYLLTETLYAFLIICSLHLLYRVPGKFNSLSPGWSAAAGLAMGAASLCRPVAVMWMLIAVLFILFYRRSRFLLRAATVAALLAGAALPIIPWMARNHALFGTFNLSTTGGIAFWEDRHRDIDKTSSDGIPPDQFTNANRTANQRNLVLEGGDTSRMVPVFNLCPAYHAFFFDQETIDRMENLSEGEADREYYRMGIEYTVEHPVKVLRESFLDAIRTFSPISRSGRINPVMFLAIPFVLLGLRALRKTHMGAWIAVLTGLLSITAISTLFYFEPRYILPYQPLIIIASATGIDMVLKNGYRGRNGVFLLAGYLLFTWASYLTLSGIVTS